MSTVIAASPSGTNASSVVQQSMNSAYLLNGTYYIGVYGYSYTTFSLLVTVHRYRLTNLEKVTNILSTQIYEGFPLSKRLHNELDMFLGHFNVNLDEN